METNNLKVSNVLSLLATFQVFSLLVYLNTNIVNVGEMGTALPVLVVFVMLSAILMCVLWIKKSLRVRPHFFILLLFVTWIALRVAIDLGDLEYLQQITIATTGGILLFYVIGGFLSVTYVNVAVNQDNVRIAKMALALFLILLVWMLYNFLQRLHPNLFYLTDVDGSYQRAGNFLSISFISVSFLYFLFASKQARFRSALFSRICWLSVYTLSTFIALVGSQLFGSNSATAVVLGVYLITLTMSLVASRKSLWRRYFKGKLAFPWSKSVLRHLVYMSLFGLFAFLALFALIISITDFDLERIRLLGFGSGSNSSLQSRIEILMIHGVSQLSYSPFLGNINVAYLTTGSSGETLHSFFLYVMANLGLVGLIIVFSLLISVVFQLYIECKRKGDGGFYFYQKSMISLYSLFILVFILIFANLATGVSWSVLWFTLGLLSRPFGFK